MQSLYSFWGSRLHIILEDEIANGYNRAVEAFFEAQENHEKTTGNKWDPSQPISIEWNEKDQAAYTAVGKIINVLNEVNGRGLVIDAKEMTSDFLVKL